MSNGEIKCLFKTGDKVIYFNYEQKNTTRSRPIMCEVLYFNTHLEKYMLMHRYNDTSRKLLASEKFLERVEK